MILQYYYEKTELINSVSISFVATCNLNSAVYKVSIRCYKSMLQNTHIFAVTGEIKAIVAKLVDLQNEKWQT